MISLTDIAGYFVSLKAKLIVLAAFFVSGGALSAYAIHKIDAWSLERKEKAWQEQTDTLIASAKDAVQKSCDANDKITQEKSHALQSRLNHTADMYVGLLSKAADCHPSPVQASGSAGRGDDSAKANVPVVQIPIMDGLAAGKLNDDQASQLIGCQDTMSDIYKANGQQNLLPKP